MSEVETIIKNTWQEAETLAGDERFRDDYKQEQIEGSFKTVMGNLEETYKREKTTLNAQIEAQSAFYVSPMPAPEEAAVLVYMRDSIKPQWEAATVADMESQWQAAIKAGDKLAARLYRDYAPPVIAQKMGVSGIPYRAQTLIAETETLLLSPEALKAKEAIEAAKTQLLNLEKAYSDGKSRLTGAKVIKGKLVAGTSIRAAAMGRSYA